MDNRRLRLRLQGLDECAGGLDPFVEAQPPGDAGADLGIAVGQQVVLQTGEDASVLDPRHQAEQDPDQVGARSAPGGILEGRQQRRHGAVGGQQQLLARRLPLLGILEPLHQVVEIRPAGRQTQGLQQDQGSPAAFSAQPSVPHRETLLQRRVCAWGRLAIGVGVGAT